MIKILRTTSEDSDFIQLVKLLDADLAVRDGEDHGFYDQFNKIDTLKHTVVLFENDIAVGCGAFKQIEAETVEIKRMYTLPKMRGKGLATIILNDLEKWAASNGFKKSVLETGKKQPEAIRLYEKNGYVVTPNYPPYQGIENSVCFEKKLVR
ncbi:GNAT family N-acetyltransferase [Ulvibacter antarcticus]|uniref:Ribosomal protein S18 acetylase RimI-like enzyme n=1 Tax=Ulvibacter antarcticus TaxID=442714 RepID=A0A3L9YFC6_9FLAO|nr:GNAT family N-acetyltransferase [Ulvibacter antarcticus]RMA58060.1 ribosomal protein S18 acetylase RimI-like enzyme [Ulvibacter antarcticus]